MNEATPTVSGALASGLKASQHSPPIESNSTGACNKRTDQRKRRALLLCIIWSVANGLLCVASLVVGVSFLIRPNWIFADHNATISFMNAINVLVMLSMAIRMAIFSK